MSKTTPLCAPVPPCEIIFPAIFFLLSLILSSPADDVHLRCGRVLSGQIAAESQTEYRLVTAPPESAVHRIPRDAVKYVLYDTPQKAERALDLPAARRLCRDQSIATVHVITTQAMGPTILKLASNAQESVWIAAYFLSGSEAAPIGDFYRILREKAAAGVDVRIVVEFSNATAPSIKRSSRNFATQLARSGIKIHLLQGQRAQHKKLLIVDGEKVLLGSSNLTLAGTTGSNEMNVLIEHPAFLRAAIADFQQLEKRATPIEKVKD